MAIKTRQYATIQEDEIKSVSISLVTPEDVKEWSNGEVTSPETINYKSYKPEKNGLFDEVIFGPVTDFKCPVCGIKYKRSNQGQVCEKTDECKAIQPKILSSSTRRTRMGHIELASPVVHFWFFKVDNSIISKLLGLRVGNSSKPVSKTALENIIYFKSHIVLEDGGLKSIPKHTIIDVNNAPTIYRDTLREILKNYKEDSDEYEDISLAIEELEETATSKIGKDYGIDFYEINEIIEEYSKAKIGTGAKAIEYLLENFDLKSELRRIKLSITKINKEGSLAGNLVDGKIADRKKLYKRLEVLRAFIDSGQDLKSMLMYSIPVLPADLRPLIQIDGGRHSTTDVNELYRRIIIRNNRLKKWNELDAPMLIKQNELRMLQEAVDALIDNSKKKPSPVMSKDNRPLKSIADALSGKKGRLRQNLLGKRVDYSGRSVIVVGPSLEMHQVGLPRQMAAKLFEPWVINKLINNEVAPSIKIAKKMIEELDNRIWPFVEQTIIGKVVLLNRAPTLHRLSIQAFEPVLVRGKAIMLHPLVTTAFNADFDGDQMAVHVPISDAAILEARELMLANKNILGPKDGEPIINPSQDMVLGLFYLTKEIKGAKGEGRIFRNYDEMIKAYDLGIVDLHARVALPLKSMGKEYSQAKDGYAISTIGKFIFNNAFPKNFPFIFDDSNQTLDDKYSKFIVPFGTNIIEQIKKMELNKPFNKKTIATIIREVFDRYNSLVSKEDIAPIIKKVNSSNYFDTVMEYSELKDYKNERLSKVHAIILSNLTRKYFEILNKRIMLQNENVERFFEIHERIELLEKIWFEYTNVVASTLDNIKELGFKYSTQSGITMAISDIIQTERKNNLVKEGDSYISDLKNKFYNKGWITSDEKYTLTIKKWTLIKNQVETELKEIVAQNEHNPIFSMMISGARGNISNFVQLSGMRGLMSKSTHEFAHERILNKIIQTVFEIPVKTSFLEGLTSFEFLSSTHGARKGLIDTALNTARAGYLTRRLVDAARNIVVNSKDCGTEQGSKIKPINDTKTNTNIESLNERIEGRFLLKDAISNKGEVLAKKGEFINQELANTLSKELTEVWIRSVFGCQSLEGVCQICYGKDLATNRIIAIGEPVGIVAAQSIGEPGTQLTMRTFHTGGVAGSANIVGGFNRLLELIDNTPTRGKKSIISRTIGKVVGIEQISSFIAQWNNKEIKYLVTNGLDKQKEYDSSRETFRKLVLVEGKDKNKTLYGYVTNMTDELRVKKDDEVKAGSKITEGSIVLNELLEFAGVESARRYQLKEIQKLYRAQGINIADKYIEIISRQMFSKIRIHEPGDTKYFAGEIVNILEYQQTNQKILSKSKIPSFGKLNIWGIKDIPSLSKSFLASASYQETSRALVKSSIKGSVDKLEGFKENIIIGHKIPAGTNFPFEAKSKFDIKNSRKFFEDNKKSK